MFRHTHAMQTTKNSLVKMDEWKFANKSMCCPICMSCLFFFKSQYILAFMAEWHLTRKDLGRPVIQVLCCTMWNTSFRGALSYAVSRVQSLSLLRYSNYGQNACLRVSFKCCTLISTDLTSAVSCLTSVWINCVPPAPHFKNLMVLLWLSEMTWMGRTEAQLQCPL